ncbi:MAG TPA: hypothetical protein VLT87_07245 [Thermoanaerobaculia bacterium]|nr:hypothetical protein [Thermoanaerobaculia bacterium]
MIVEDAASATTRTNTLVRDELGTVLGLVAEDKGSDPAKPPVPVRYRYPVFSETIEVTAQAEAASTGPLVVLGSPEIAPITSVPPLGPAVEQYALRAAESGFYPVMSRGSKLPTGVVWLEEGEVWKFGTTKNPRRRYSLSYLDNVGDKGVIYTTEWQVP